MSGSSFRDNSDSSPRYKHQSDEQTSDDGAAVLRRASDAATQAAVRLDQRTHLDSGRYRIVLRDYGGGLGEIGWSEVARQNETGV